MQRNKDAYKYRILEMILRGEETLALSQEERVLFKSLQEIQKQALLLCGVGHASVVADATDVPINRYIEMRSGLMEKQKRDLFYILDRKAAERQPMNSIGRPPRAYVRAALRHYVQAHMDRDAAIRGEALALDYADGVAYGSAPTSEVYAAAEQIVSRRLEKQWATLQRILKESRILPVIMGMDYHDDHTFVATLGTERYGVSYSLAAGDRRQRG